MVEEWQETYEKEVEIYDTFSRYEDEENKLLNKLLEKFSFRGKIVLEVGCGSGKYSELLAPKSKKYFGLEISKPLIELAKQKCEKFKNVKFFNCSAEKIPLDDNSVDVVFASWVLTAMISDEMREKSIKEILRVLNDGGEIWLFENHWEGEFMNLRGKKNVKFEECDIYPLIKKYGFEIVEIIDTNFFFPSLDEIKRVTGFIFGKNALKYLDKKPQPKIKHKAVILHKIKRPTE